MADASRIAHLIVKKLCDELTIEEKNELDSWIQESPEDRQEFMETRMRPEVLDKKLTAFLNNNPSQPAPVYLDPPTALRRSKISAATIFYWTLAAIFLGGVITTVVKKYDRYRATKEFSKLRKEADFQSIQNSTVQNPTLELASGSVVELGQNHDRTLAKDAGWNIIEEADLTLAYLFLGQNSDDDSKENKIPVKNIAYNILSTPKGSPGRVIRLPGGTIATLGPESTLRYPVGTPGVGMPYHVLYLIGEATFTPLRKPNAPFYVETIKGEIKVLGTRFKVRDYGSEDTLGLILYEGKVSLTNGRSTAVVNPGYSATISNEGIQIKEVDISKQPPPVPNEFDFTNMNIRSGLEEISQWYGLSSPVFRSGVDTSTIGNLGWGKIRKYISLPELLEHLESPECHFQIEDKTIIVSR